MHLCLMFTRFFRINSRRFPILKHLRYGGPNGELGASLRYLSQRYMMPDDVTKGLLTDIGVSTTILPPNTNKVNDTTNSMSFTLFKGILNHF